MPTGLVALLDDIAGITKLAAASLDDIGAATGKAGSKAIGVVVDDAAVTPRYVVGLTPDRGSLVRVHGDSMAPTIAPGNLVLVDGGRTEGSKGRVYALVDVSGDTRVKRLDRIDHSTLILRSDNPAHAPELRTGPDLDRLRIIGEVRWSGHTWR